jgi:hypothetical protein
MSLSVSDELRALQSVCFVHCEALARALALRGWTAQRGVGVCGLTGLRHGLRLHSRGERPPHPRLELVVIPMRFRRVPEPEARMTLHGGLYLQFGAHGALRHLLPPATLTLSCNDVPPERVQAFLGEHFDAAHAARRLDALLAR